MTTQSQSHERNSLWDRLGIRHMFSFGSFLWDAVIFVWFVKMLFFS
jgi:hypothetical protein